MDPVTYPVSRAEDIYAVKNEIHKNEKTAVWNLLAYAVEDTFCRSFSDFTFMKSLNGKWISPDFYFSLSHSHNGVAVALSDSPVGVDIEDLSRYSGNKDSEKRRLDLLIKKACTHEEQLRCTDDLAFMKLWTAKEAVFKASDSRVFTPEQIKVSDHPVTSFLISGENRYVLSVCSSEKASFVHIHRASSHAETLPASFPESP